MTVCFAAFSFCLMLLSSNYADRWLQLKLSPGTRICIFTDVHVGAHIRTERGCASRAEFKQVLITTKPCALHRISVQASSIYFPHCQPGIILSSVCSQAENKSTKSEQKAPKYFLWKTILLPSSSYSKFEVTQLVFFFLDVCFLLPSMVQELFSQIFMLSDSSFVVFSIFLPCSCIYLSHLYQSTLSFHQILPDLSVFLVKRDSNSEEANGIASDPHQEKEIQYC